MKINTHDDDYSAMSHSQSFDDSKYSEHQNGLDSNSDIDYDEYVEKFHHEFE